MTEDAKAKEYWSSTEAQHKEYGKPPFYVSSLVHVISRLEPDGVLEMGCNAGRNLEVLRRSLPHTRLRGFDINGRSIEYGRAKWGLELDVADEDYLAKQPERSVDVVFTVSVLDHLPKIDGVLSDLARIAHRYYVAIEPFPEEELRYLDVFKKDGRCRPAVTTTTPYSYLHPYRALAAEAGLTACLDLPMPPYGNNWGPLYRLTVYERPDVARPFTQWETLRDELIFDAIRATK